MLPGISDHDMPIDDFNMNQNYNKNNQGKYTTSKRYTEKKLKGENQ